MPSIGAQILTALQARLQTIKTTAGYANTLKSVRLNTSEPTLSTSEMDLPLLEIIEDGETYDHDMGTSYWAEQVIILYLVAPKAWTDSQMQDLLTDVRKCLFGGTADASGNTGMTLGGLLSGGMRLIDATADLNMISSNRVYMMRVRLRSQRTTFRS